MSTFYMLAFFSLIKDFCKTESIMVKVQIKKRGKYFQYTFEIAPQDGKRKWITKSGFKSKPEAEEQG